MRQKSPPHRVTRMTATATISKHAALTAQVSRIQRDDATSSWPQSIDGVNFSIAGLPPSAAYRSTQYGESALTTQPPEGSSSDQQLGAGPTSRLPISCQSSLLAAKRPSGDVCHGLVRQRRLSEWSQLLVRLGGRPLGFAAPPAPTFPDHAAMGLIDRWN